MFEFPVGARCLSCKSVLLAPVRTTRNFRTTGQPLWFTNENVKSSGCALASAYVWAASMRLNGSLQQRMNCGCDAVKDVLQARLMPLLVVINLHRYDIAVEIHSYSAILKVI